MLAALCLVLSLLDHLDAAEQGLAGFRAQGNVQVADHGLPDIVGKPYHPQRHIDVWFNEM